MSGVEATIYHVQDTKEEQRAKRKRLLSAAATARIKRGMIRYLQVPSLIPPSNLALAKDISDTEGCKSESSNEVVGALFTAGRCKGTI